MTNPPSNASGSKSKGALVIAAGVGVFIVCSIVQGIGGSSMFESSFQDPDNFLLELLMQVTFWPGCLATGALVLLGFTMVLSKRGEQ